MIGAFGKELGEGDVCKLLREQTNRFYGRAGYGLPAGTKVSFISPMEQPVGGYSSLAKCKILQGPHRDEFAALEAWILDKL